MQLTIGITYEGGETETVSTLPVDLVALEREHKASITALANRGLGMSEITFLAWHAAKRHTDSPGRGNDGKHPPYDVWLNRIVEVDMAADDEADRPTPPAASTS